MAGLVPEFGFLPPATALRFDIRPTVAPIITGASGPGGELSLLEVSHLVIRILPANADVAFIEVAVDAQLGLDLGFTGGELSVTLGPLGPGQSQHTILRNRMGTSEVTLDVLIPLLLQLTLPSLTDSLGTFPLRTSSGCSSTSWTWIETVSTCRSSSASAHPEELRAAPLRQNRRDPAPRQRRSLKSDHRCDEPPRTPRRPRPVEKRRSPRFRTRFDALISATSEEGAGVLAEISYAGARLEGTDMRPPVGTKVTLYVFVQPVAPFELRGEVARLTETGFALTYELDDPEIRRLVDDVSAIVTAPSTR